MSVRKKTTSDGFCLQQKGAQLAIYSVTIARQITPGATYLVTRRCTQRQFLLKPSKRTTEVFEYCLAVAAERTNIEVHAVCVLSNHWHSVVTDPDGKLPEFVQILHRLVSRVLNISYDRSENLWSTEPPSYVRLEDSAAVFDKIVYTVCNPVQAGLVVKPSRWPGLLAYLPKHQVTVNRPKIYFDPEGDMPAMATLKIVAPPQVGDAKEYFSRIEEACKQRVEAIKVHRRGKGYLGRRAVMAQRIDDTPTSQRKRSRHKPRVATKNKWLRMEANQRLRGFVQHYTEALKCWISGDQTVEFPQGTYAMRVRYGVAIAQAPPTS